MERLALITARAGRAYIEISPEWDTSPAPVAILANRGNGHASDTKTVHITPDVADEIADCITPGPTLYVGTEHTTHQSTDGEPIHVSFGGSRATVNIDHVQVWGADASRLAHALHTAANVTR